MLPDESPAKRLSLLLCPDYITESQRMATVFSLKRSIFSQKLGD